MNDITDPQEQATDPVEEQLLDETPPTSDEFKVSQPGNINPEVLQNISVNLSIEVGRTNIKIKDLMRLTQGSVVELDRIAGEPLDLLVNDTVVAQGEVVLVNDRYGIRLTRVVPSTDRLKSILFLNKYPSKKPVCKRAFSIVVDILGGLFFGIGLTLEQFAKNQEEHHRGDCKHQYITAETEITEHVLEQGHHPRRHAHAQQQKRQGEQLGNHQDNAQQQRNLKRFHGQSLLANLPIVPLSEDNTSDGTNTILVLLPTAKDCTAWACNFLTSNSMALAPPSLMALDTAATA
jgi:flagellar motor switch protein FliN/FliY